MHSKPIASSAATLNSHSLQQLEVLLSAIGDGVNVVSTDGILRYTNRAFNDMFGYAEGELIGQHIAIVNAVTERSAQQTAQAIAAELAARGVWEGDLLNARKDGSTFWTSAKILTSQSVEWGKVWVSVLRDVTERKQLFDRVESSERRYRTVVEDQTEVICRILPDGTFVFVNDVYCRVFGKPAEALIGQRWHPIAHPDDVPMVLARLAEMSADNPVVTIENRVFVASGDLRWMQFVNRGFYDAKGELAVIQAVGRDITRLKETEKALRESQAILERAQAVAHIGSFAMAVDTDRFYYTKETARLFGLDDGLETCFAEWFSRVHPDDQAIVEAAWRGALQGAPYDLTYRIVVGGQVRWIKALAEMTFDLQGNLVDAVGSLQDVTDQKRSEDAARESEERLEMALAGSGQTLWDWHLAEGQILFGGPWYQMLGYPEGAAPMPVDDWRRMCEPQDLQRFDSALAEHLAGASPILENEHRLRHRNGHWVTVLASAKITRRLPDGTPSRMVGTVLDISSRKRLNEEGIKLLKQIESLIRENASGSHARTTKSDSLDTLTKRERQVLGMIARGMTSAQIGHQLNLSANTVANHRQNLMAKLNLHNTAEITRFAIDHDLEGRP